MRCKALAGRIAVSFNCALMPWHNAGTDLMRVSAPVALVEAAKRSHIVRPNPVALDSLDDRCSACLQSDIVGVLPGTHDCSPVWNTWECSDV